MPHITSPMLLKVLRQKRFVRSCSTYKYQSIEEKLKRETRMYHCVALQIVARNKKLQEKLFAQNVILEEFRKDRDSDKWWISEKYAEQIYWTERELQMVANEKY